MSRGNSNNKSLGETLITVAAWIGGAWLTAKLLEKHSKTEVKYSCPNCSSDIDYEQKQCRVCKANLKWDF